MPSRSLRHTAALSFFLATERRKEAIMRRSYMFALVMALAGFLRAEEGAPEWRVTLTAMNQRPVLYEPAWIQWEEEYVGPVPDGEWSRDPRWVCMSSPDRATLEYQPGGDWVGQVVKDVTKVKLGERRLFNYLLPSRAGRFIFEKPGRYELSYNCPKIWQGHPGADDIRSNTIAFIVKEPSGEDQAALAAAGGPGPLAELMGLRASISAVGKKWFPGSSPSNKKRPFGDFVAAQINLVTRFPNSAYAPYVLLHLIQMAEAGYTADAQPMWEGSTSLKPVTDWAGVRHWSELFLKRYPRHPLADEATYLHSRSLLELGERDAAVKELRAFEGTCQTSPLMPFVKSMLAALNEKDSPLPKWEYHAKWARSPSSERAVIP